ncbi:nitrate- and nitrite sensing domain-containing protein [Streptomyces sp. NPDC050585]|uniref:sensor histidine kinase n=1 Tax=Streptomyces sp. NPDC050585 TaxID=3365632 RepID=UPI00378B8702
MSAMEPEGTRGPSTRRRRRTVRLRTLLVMLAVVPTLAMGAQVVVTADRLLEQSEHLRSDVDTGERIGLPLYTLMTGLQAERSATAAHWSDPGLPESELTARRAATDRAAAAFRRAAALGGAGSQEADRRLLEIREGLDALPGQRERMDSRTGYPDTTVAYFNGLIGQVIRFYQDAFSHTEDGELTQESQVVVSLFSAAEMLAQQDTAIALAGPSRELSASRFAELLNLVGAHRYLYDQSIAPYLPPEDAERYARLVGSGAWQAKTRIENHILSDHKDLPSGVRLPREVTGWSTTHASWRAELEALNAARTKGLLAHGDAKASALETEVTWLIALSSAGLLAVVGVVAATTRSVLRRLRLLHDRTVRVADTVLPDVVARLRDGRPVDEEALPSVRGDRDEVGQISDAFARVVAVSVDGHRELAAERHGFGSFAAGIASRTGNLVSRQLSLTEELQDTFGADEALLAQLMKADQLTVGMRRQIENLLILAGGEVPDPHTEPMRVADLLLEAAAEVEEFRRIDRQALDEISVEPRVISQVSHLLAELLDNATRFSPPRSRVVVRAELVADGLSVEIEDRGPRVSPERYAEMNARLHSAPPYAVLAEEAHRLGLFVVGHLADQLGATVTLRRSVFGGTSAVVVIPGRLLVPTADGAVRKPAPAPAPVPLPARRAPAAVPAPAHDTAADPAHGTARAGAPDPAHDAARTGAPGKAAGRARHTAADPAGDRAAGPVPQRAEHGAAGDEVVRGDAAVRPELVLHPGAALPVRTTRPRAKAPSAGTAPGGTRPPLPERVPQTHMAEELRNPRAGADGAGARNGGTSAHDRAEATPEEVADAWADYEDGTRKVEAELRQEQP